MSVGFCAAVSFNEPQTVSQKMLGFADSYLSLGCLGCRRVEVLTGFAKDGKEAVINDPSKSSSLVTTLKVISYLTVILPLLALITKLALRSCAHRFYLLDPKQAAEEVLKKVEAGKPLTNTDLKFLPLSRLSEDQINSIFDLDNALVEESMKKLRERFALIPASEVAEAVRKINKKENPRFFSLISESQCKALNVNLSNFVQVICASSINLENIHKGKGFLKAAEIVERMRSKMANIDPKALEDILFDSECDEEMYHILSDQQLMKLKISQFDERMIRGLIDGLCIRPEDFFDDFTIKEVLPESRRRFALLDIKELKRTISKEAISFENIADLASESQFQALRFGDISKENFEKLFRTEEEHIENSKRLFKLMPQAEISKALLDGRLDKDLHNELKS